jgi:hypothetical protein
MAKAFFVIDKTVVLLKIGTSRPVRRHIDAFSWSCQRQYNHARPGYQSLFRPDVSLPVSVGDYYLGKGGGRLVGACGSA